MANPESRGWTDILDTDRFRDGEIIGSVHECRKEGKVLTCHVEIMTLGSIVVIDYAGANSERNDNEGVYIGQSLLFFDTSRRGSLVQVLWRDEVTGIVENLKPDIA